MGSPAKGDLEIFYKSKKDNLDDLKYHCKLSDDQVFKVSSIITNISDEIKKTASEFERQKETRLQAKLIPSDNFETETPKKLDSCKRLLLQLSALTAQFSEQ